MPPAPGAPQPAAGSSADRDQITTSNQTLHAFLGHNRPAWMTDTNPPPAMPPGTGTAQPEIQAESRKRGRPRKHPLPEFIPTQAPVEQQLQHGHTRSNSVLPSPALTNEPSPAASGNAASPHGSAAVVAGNQPLSSSPQISAAQTSTSHAQIPEPGTQDPPGSRPSSSGFRNLVPATESRQDATSVPDPSERPQKRQRVNASGGNIAHDSAPAIASLEPLMGQWFTALNERLQYCGGLGRLDPSLERPRHQMLLDACLKGDAFYILLQQQFCLWSLDKPAVHGNFPIHPQTIDFAFGLLNHVLRDNQEMARQHVQWLARFPVPFRTVAQSLAPHLDVRGMIGQFLDKFASNWNGLIGRIATRHYPLLAYEATEILLCPSPILQEVLFTLSRRRIGIEDGRFATDLNGRFRKDQIAEATMTRDGTPQDEVQNVRRSMAVRYHKLIQSVRELAIQKATMAQGPRTASAAMTSPNFPHHPQLPQPPQVSPALVLPSYTDGSNPQVGSPGYGHSTALPGQNPAHSQPMNVAPVFQNPITPIPQPQGLTPHLTHQATGSFQPAPNPPGSWGWNASPNGSHPQQCNANVQSPFPMHLNHPPPVRSSSLSMQQPWQHQPNVSQPRRTASGGPRHTARESPATSPRQGSRPPGLYPVRRIPENEYPTNPYDWSSVRPSLHLIHLRSPKRVPAEPGPSRHYQFVSGLPVPPRAFPPQTGLRSMEFSISENEISQLSMSSPSDGFRLSKYVEGSLRYRLRLCARKQKGEEIKENEWVTLPCHWPEHIHVTVNGLPTFPRRKQHFHLDLPIELTDDLVFGKNTVKVSLPDLDSNKKPGLHYFMAVELVTTLGHESVKLFPDVVRHITADETRQEVRRRLKPLDDDIVIENDVLSVTVADPFRSTMFKVPVRGVDCRHLECFDLETWLETRPGKPKAVDEPSLVDAWRCPICNVDARPQSLRIDDFFVEVRKKLVEEGREGTKVIHIRPDGTWTAVEEAVEAAGDGSDDEAPAPRPVARPPHAWHTSTSRRASQVVPETIEILDD